MTIFRASEIGANCLRGLVAQHLGEKAIPYGTATELIFAEGNLHEGAVIATLEADGYTVTRQQEEVNVWFSGEQHYSQVQGHLDGVISDDLTGQRVLEIKAPGDSEFKKFKAAGWETPGLWQKYKWQLSVYMLATGLEALFVVKNRNSGEILRFGVEEPFYTLDQIAARVAFLEDHISRGVLPDDCPHDWFCNYKYLCSTLGEEEGAERSPSDEPWLDDAQVTAAAARYVQLAARMKAVLAPVAAELEALKAEQAEVKDLLKSALPGLVEPNRAYRAGDYMVTWVESEVAASTRKYASVKPVKKEQS